MPLLDKGQAIKHKAVPTNIKELRNFIGVMDCYRDIWKHRSDTLIFLTKMISK